MINAYVYHLYVKQNLNLHLKNKTNTLEIYFLMLHAVSQIKHHTN